MTTGEGGMITTNNEEVQKVARSLQNRGRDMEYKQELYSKPGRNIRMPEISALIGRVQLKNLDRFLKNRRLIAEIYKNTLHNINYLDFANIKYFHNGYEIILNVKKTIIFFNIILPNCDNSLSPFFFSNKCFVIIFSL